MKKLLIIATAALALSTSTVVAGELAFNAYGEYAVEAQGFELGVGADYSLQAVTIYSEAVFTKPQNVDFDFDHVDVGVSYNFTNSTKAYGEITLDKQFDYSEAVVGVAVNF